jgi:hypothetical protein
METSLRGVERTAKYKVRLHRSYNLGKEEVLTREQLRNWAVSIPRRRGSLLVRYERVE